jgi:Uri superfamily endonuclease
MSRFVASLGGNPARFEPGYYAYSGSAYGPGGIAARLAHHFQRNKKPPWHVDRLTVAACFVQAIALEAGSEYEIVARLAGSAAFAPFHTGFGSSGCRRCETHLLRWLGAASTNGTVPTEARGHGRRPGGVKTIHA